MRLFVNVYESPSTTGSFANVVHHNRATADRMACSGRLDCVEVEFDGTVEAARTKLEDFSAGGLRMHFPVIPSAVQTPTIPQVAKRLLTLPVDSEERKNIPLVAGFLNYVPAAVVKFAQHAKAGNDKHNKGQPLHHARWKSTDHEECLFRHLMDIQDYNAHIARGTMPSEEAIKALISEATAEFWRAGVFLQELCEKYEGAPLAPGARVQE